MSGIEIVPMREKAGALVRGFDGPANLFDQVIDALSEFYGNNDLVLVQTSDSHSLKFEPGERYEHRVYGWPEIDGRPVESRDGRQVLRGGEINYVFPRSKTPFHGYLNQQYLGKELHLGKYVPEWDFPHAVSSWESDHFALYWDIMTKFQPERRTEMMEFVKQVGGRNE